MIIMCGIAGAYSFQGSDISTYLKKMLYILRHRGPHGCGAIIRDKVVYGSIDEITFPRGEIGIGYNMLNIIGKGPQPIPNEKNDLWLVHDGEIYNFMQLRNKLSSRHTFRTNINSEAILHAYEDLQLHLIDGVFAFAIYDINNECLEIYRDFIGAKPLFYCKARNIFMFASERKAFLPFCTPPSRLPPGHRLIIERDSISLEKFYSLDDIPILSMKNVDKMIQVLENALIKAVEKRLYKPTAILFSGGIDSSLISKIASDLGGDIRLYTVGLRGSRDIKSAIAASRELGLEISIYEIKENEVPELFSLIARIIDEPDPLKILIGIPIYIAAREIAKDGFRVVLLGQGADELFGGYARYLNFKKEEIEIEMLNDLRNIHIKNAERDDHCLLRNSVEGRFPYLDMEIIKIALSIPVEYKIRNNVRKWILRKVAKKIGLPTSIVTKEKKAIQYGSGVVKVMKQFAKKCKITLEELARKAIQAE